MTFARILNIIAMVFLVVSLFIFEPVLIYISIGFLVASIL